MESYTLAIALETSIDNVATELRVQRLLHRPEVVGGAGLARDLDAPADIDRDAELADTAPPAAKVRYRQQVAVVSGQHPRRPTASSGTARAKLIVPFVSANV